MKSFTLLILVSMAGAIFGKGNFTVPYCPEGSTLSGSEFEIIKQSIVDAIHPSYPEYLVGAARVMYQTEVRQCIIELIPNFMSMFNPSEEDKEILSQVARIVSDNAMNIKVVDK